MKPFPINGLVPWGVQCKPVLRRRMDPKFHWVYDLAGVSNVDHQTLMECITERAAYQVGQKVAFPRMRALEVMQRRWSFSKGDVRYFIGNPRLKMGGGRWFTQTYLLKHRSADDDGEVVTLEDVY
jgi:hypothetical protein